MQIFSPKMAVLSSWSVAERARLPPETDQPPDLIRTTASDPRQSRTKFRGTYCEQRTNSVRCFSSRGTARLPALSARRIMVIRRVSMAQPALRVVEGASMDKSKALDAALSQIER